MARRHQGGNRAAGGRSTCPEVRAALRGATSRAAEGGPGGGVVSSNYENPNTHPRACPPGCRRWPCIVMASKELPTSAVPPREYHRSRVEASTFAHTAVSVHTLGLIAVSGELGSPTFTALSRNKGGVPDLAGPPVGRGGEDDQFLGPGCQGQGTPISAAPGSTTRSPVGVLAHH